MEKVLTIIKPVIASLLRHGLTAGGLGAVVSADGIEQAVGAVVTLIGLGWSVFNGIKDKRKADSAK